MWDLAPDLIVVIADRSDADLVALCKDVVHGADTRIVVCATDARSSDPAMRAALHDAGAHEHIDPTMPGEVLAARMRALLRAPAPRVRSSHVVIGDVCLDLDLQRVTVGGEPRPCPPLHFSLLATLADAPGRVVTRDALAWMGWGMRLGDLHGRQMSVAMRGVRRVLGDGPRRPRVETVGQSGYRLVVP
jgi:two-component system KDP operon response regulator KdpE